MGGQTKKGLDLSVFPNWGASGAKPRTQHCKAGKAREYEPLRHSIPLIRGTPVRMVYCICSNDWGGQNEERERQTDRESFDFAACFITLLWSRNLAASRHTILDSKESNSYSFINPPGLVSPRSPSNCHSSPKCKWV